MQPNGTIPPTAAATVIRRRSRHPLLVPDVVLPIHSHLAESSKSDDTRLPIIKMCSPEHAEMLNPVDTGSGSCPDFSGSSSYIRGNLWAQSSALDRILAWGSRHHEDDICEPCGDSSKSDISSSFCFSTLKDDKCNSNSEMLTAIMYVNQNRAGGLFDLLLDNPDLVGMCDGRGNRLIHYAVSRGFLHIIDLLVSRGADINQANVQGHTPLHLAVMEQQVAALGHLILLGGNVELADNKGVQPIHLACELNDTESLKEILRATNVDINAPGEFGSTVAHCCCRKNNVDCLEIVLRANADVFKADAIGNYPIHVAVSSGSLDCLYLLFDHETTTKTLAATGIGFSDLQLVNLPDSEGETALHLAVNSGNDEMIKFCLNHDADLGAPQNDGCTSIHYAARRGEISVLSQLLQSRQDEETVSLLSGVNRNGRTPLHLAVMYDHSDLTAFLIRQRSPMEVQDNNGWTPLLLATTQCAAATCITLIKLGADLHAFDLSGRNILHLAIIYGALKDEALWKRIAEHGLFTKLIAEQDEFGCTPLHYATKGALVGITRDLLARGSNCLTQNNERETPLHVAAQTGCLAIVESLLRTDHGLWSMNTPDALGRLPLHIAAANGHIKVVSLLIAKGSGFRRCQKGATPLHWAAEAGCLETCKIILGANPYIIDVRDFRGMTALHYAAKNDNDFVLAYLLKKGAKFEPDANGLYFTTFALKSENRKAARAVVFSERWGEIVNLLNHSDQCPIETIIRENPSLCPAIMDRYICQEGNHCTAAYEVKYDFSILQPRAELLDKSNKSPLHLLQVMIALQRNDLITHPLCMALLRCKWRRYGLWTHCISTAFYVTFLACLSIVVLDHEPERHTAHFVTNETCFNMVFSSPSHRRRHMVLSYSVAITSSVCILGDLLLLLKENLLNLYSLMVFTIALSYATMSLSEIADHRFVELSAIALFLAWSYLIIHLMSFNVVGIFVVMFFQVAKTIGKSGLVVVLVMISCGLPFYILFKVPDDHTYQYLPLKEKQELAMCFPTYQYIYNKTLKDGTSVLNKTPTLSAFQAPYWAIIYVLSMSLGDFNFVDMIMEPFIDDNPLTLHFPLVTVAVFVVFLLLAPMMLTNLLVGLAVGDIDNVRKQAAIRLISQVVEWHDHIESAVPRTLYRLLVATVWHSNSRKDSPRALGSTNAEAAYGGGLLEVEPSYPGLLELQRQVETQSAEIHEILAILREHTGSCTLRERKLTDMSTT